MSLKSLIDKIEKQLKGDDLDSFRANLIKMNDKIISLTATLNARNPLHTLHHDNPRRLAAIQDIKEAITAYNNFVIYAGGWISSFTAFESRYNKDIPSYVLDEFKATYEKEKLIDQAKRSFAVEFTPIQKTCFDVINSLETAYDIYLRDLRCANAPDLREFFSKLDKDNKSRFKMWFLPQLGDDKQQPMQVSRVEEKTAPKLNKSNE